MNLSMIKSLWVILLALLFSLNALAEKNNSFPIVKRKFKTSIIIDKSDAKVVELTANLLSDDIFKITGTRIDVGNKIEKTVIIAGTLGKNKLINKLVKENKIKIDQIK